MSLAFSKKLIDALLCQQDESSLEIEHIESQDDSGIFAASLKCPSCQKVYWIKKGILNLLENQTDLDSTMKDEIEARDKEAEKYDERLSVRYHKEVPSTLKTIGTLKDKKLIEYGCGTGRLTKHLVDDSELVLANDFSLKSLLILREKLDGRKNVGLVLADSVQLKTKEKYFDIACSFQFLEHVPSQEQRQDFLQNVKKTLVDKALFVSTVYHFDLRRVIKKKPVEGKHSSGIFFHYFNSQEIRKEFEKYFSVLDLRPIDINLPLEGKLKLAAKSAGSLSRMFEKIPFINKLGHLLIVKAKKL